MDTFLLIGGIIFGGYFIHDGSALRVAVSRRNEEESSL